MTTLLDGVEMSKEALEAYADEHGLYIDWEQIGDSGALTEAETLNYENKQHTLSAIIPAEDEAYEQAMIDLRITDQYHSYSHTVADETWQDEVDRDGDYIDMDEVNDLTADQIERYNVVVAAANKYGEYAPISDDMTRNEINDVILGNM